MKPDRENDHDEDRIKNNQDDQKKDFDEENYEEEDYDDLDESILDEHPKSEFFQAEMAKYSAILTEKFKRTGWLSRDDEFTREECLLFYKKLEQRFGVIPIQYIEKIKNADKTMLDHWEKRISTAKRIDDVFV